MTKEEMFNENIKLAYKNAQHYKNCGIEYEDLKQICLYALWKAVLTYKQEKKYAFSSYAYRVIQNEVNYYLRSNRKHFNNKHFSDLIYENFTLEDTLADTYNQIEEAERNIDNKNYIKKIKESNIRKEEKQVLELLTKDYKQRQIAEIIGCSQPQVSRLIRKIKSNYINMQMTESKK